MKFNDFIFDFEFFGGKLHAHRWVVGVVELPINIEVKQRALADRRVSHQNVLENIVVI